MFVRNAAAVILTIGLLSKDALAELITITQYASTCSAIYTTGSRSITIVQSTTTVVPVPYDDAAWNGGTPFVLGVEPGAATDPLARRADLVGRSWLTLNGNTSTDPLSAGQYYIRGGQLLSVNGSYVSTNLNVESQPFSIANTPGAISTTFTFKDGVLNWTSPRFTAGRAKFCKQPVNLIENAQIQCQFLGDVESPDACTPIRLVATPCAEVNPLSSSSILPTGTISVTSSMVIMSSMSNGPPDQYTPPSYSSNQPRSSSSTVVLPPVSTPAASTSAPSSTGVSSQSPPVAYSSTRATSSNAPSPSSAGPPIYSSPTPSPIPSPNSSSSSSSLISFASSGSPIGPINPTPYGSTSLSSSSSSVSISSGGVRSSPSSTLSSTSSIGLPPIYPSETPISSSMSMAPTSSGIVLPSPSSSSSLVSNISFASSESRPPVYTPPAVSPSSTASSTTSSSSSSILPPVVYPSESSTYISISASLPLSTTLSLSSTVLVPSSSSIISPPLYTGGPQPCPGGNNTIYIDAAGMAYTIYCNRDSIPGSYAAPVVLDFASCIQRCDLDPECGSVSHTAEDFCYLKKTPEYYFDSDTDLAVRIAGTPPIYTGPSSNLPGSTSSSQAPPVYRTTSSSSMVSSSSSAMVSSSSSSSSAAPEEYQGPTTTTTTTTSSSSSAQVPDQYDHTTTSSSSSTQAPDQYAQTTTTTTSSSSASSSAASSTIPYSDYLVLPSPTICDFGDPPTYDEDDSYCEVDLPFPVQLYSVSSVRTFASSNGYIGLNRGSQQFQVNRLPYSAIPENSIVPFFDDMFLYGRKNPRQGIYYQVEGTKVTWEYYVGRSAQSDPDKARLSQSIYHFTMAYDSAVPNTFVYTYFNLGNTEQQDPGVNGASAAVGLQGLDGNGRATGTTFSFREANITPGTQISCSGTTNSCANVPNPVIPGVGGPSR